MHEFPSCTKLAHQNHFGYLHVKCNPLTNAVVQKGKAPLSQTSESNPIVLPNENDNDKPAETIARKYADSDPNFLPDANNNTAPNETIA